MLLALGSLLALAGAAAQTPSQDATFFVGGDRPCLFRFDRGVAVPFGTARFSRPIAMVAAPQLPALFVLDAPAPGPDPRARLWRIDPDGAARIMLRHALASSDQSLGLDAEGRVLLCDGSGGLSRLEPDGRLRPLVQLEQGELKYAGAAIGVAAGEVLLATRYVVSGRGTHSQGGLYRLDLRREPPASIKLHDNVVAGIAQRPSTQTLWRDPSQLLLDGRGRLLLVDAGEPDLLGGIFCFENGGLRDLTYATPEGKAELLRHPTSIAAWTADSWIVADAAMYPGPGGSGGLFELKADGRRGEWWRFGPRCKPIAVARLPVTGASARAAPRHYASFAGVHRAGATRILAAAGQRRVPTGRTVAGMFIQTGFEEQTLPPDAAAAELERIAGAARWILGPAGTIVFAGGGVDPGAEGPDVCRGTADLYHHEIAFDTTSRGRTRADPAKSFVRGMLRHVGKDALEAHVFYYRGEGETVLQGEFVQTLALPPGRSVPAVAPLGDLAGAWRAAEPDAFGFVVWTREEIEGQPGSPSYGLYSVRKPIPRDTAIAGVRGMLREATWRILPSGEVAVDTPLGRLTGTLQYVEQEAVVSLSAMLPHKLWCLLSGRLERRADGALIAWLAFDHAWQKEQVRAEFGMALRRQE